jgi:serine/threonine protein kinase/tetratricopeptide (TPR) repeat protein
MHVQRIGRFTVVRELGHGGMGRVYLARDPELQRDVAIKLIHRTSAGASGARAQFLEEARALARMSHPGIVTLFEIGEHDDQQFIAMEYLRGRSLREVLASDRPPRERVLQICGEVARAVDAAHARGILHRDIKPENVVVLEDGGVKVVDFGLARRLDVRSLPVGATVESLDQVALDETVRMLTEAETEATHVLATLRADASPTIATVPPQGTVAGTLFGTPAYMAPEILRGAPATKATDVYSLGVMLHECLAGKRPYDAKVLAELIDIVTESQAPPQLDGDPIAPFVARMLAPDPTQRPPLSEIANLLAPLLTVSGQHVPLPERPPPPPPRRSRVPAIAAVAAVLAIGAGVAITQRGGATAKVPARVRVSSVPAALPSWSSDVSLIAVSSVLAQLIRREPSVATIAPSTNAPGSAYDAADDVVATHVLTGRLDQQGDRAIASFILRDVRGRFAVPFVVDGEVKRLPMLLADLAEQITHWIDPDVASGLADPMRAANLHQLGYLALQRGAWYESRIFLEQSVQIDPNSGDAWRHLASARGWTIAPRELMEEAIGNAVRLERDPAKRQIWVGAMHFYRDEQPEAIRVLKPLEARSDLAETDVVDLWNYLGEAYWHDGSPQLAMPYFNKLLAHRPPFLQVRAHVYDYSLYQGDFERAARLYGVERSEQEITFARGNYDQLVDDKTLYGSWARLALGKSTDLAFLGGRLGKIYALAAEPDPAKFATLFAALRTELDASPAAAIWEHFGFVTEIVLVAEDRDATRQILEMQRDRGYQPFRNYHRTEVLAAGVLGEPKQLSREGLTTRQTITATAIEAELAGDHARAIELLRPLVRDPSAGWEYGERAALIRNLAAAKRTTELADECKILTRPPIFRPAWIPLTRICKRLVR